MTLASHLASRLSSYTHCCRWVVGLSGGIDSVVLLHALSLIPSQQRSTLAAIHVNHGLSPNADQWSQFCQAFCRRLDIPLIITSVSIPSSGNVEAHARNARYAAFSRHLQASDVLLSAQHQDDQAETLLYRLFRGAGVTGLAAMPFVRPLGPTQLVRPLLSVSKSVIESHAEQHQLTWCEDESNAVDRFDRNFLRLRVLPVIKQRWPTAARQMAQSAEHMAEANTLLDEMAVMDCQACEQPFSGAMTVENDGAVYCLSVARILALSPARQRNLIRYCFRQFDCSPTTAQLVDLRQQLQTSSCDAQPRWAWPTVTVTQSVGCLWFLPGIVSPRTSTPAPFELRQGVFPLGDGVELRVEAVWGQGLRQDAALQLRFSGMSTRFKPRWRQHSSTLKQLYQHQGVLPLHRAWLPCVFAGDSCVAAVGVGVDKEYTASAQEQGWRLKVALNQCIYLCE